jgi:hypothetical protein
LVSVGETERRKWQDESFESANSRKMVARPLKALQGKIPGQISRGMTQSLEHTLSMSLASLII